MADRPAFVYVIYIKSKAAAVWHALTDAAVTAEYWGHSNVSDWQLGSRWEHQRTDGTGSPMLSVPSLRPRRRRDW